MRSILFSLLSLVTFSASSQDLKSGGILKPEQALMDVRHYTISLAVDPAQQSINGFTEIKINLKESTNVLLFDLVSLLQVKNVWVNKKKQPFTHADDLIRISLSSPAPAGSAIVKIEYGGKPGVSPNPPWKGGFTWAKDSLGNPWVAITCQGEGAKIYFPCKDHPSDEPNEGADLIISVPDGLYVAGPGKLVRTSKRKSLKAFHWKTSYTINNYAIVFNVGKYKVMTREFTSMNGRKIPMQFYVLESHAHKGNRHLDAFERCVRHEEKYFGPYPWPDDKIAICETPHLGMEHQTLNAYGNKFKYTDVGNKDFDWLLLHELGHEWFGNKVTANDWADMWIQEGITTYVDYLYTQDYGGKDAYMKQLRETARNIVNNKPIVQGKNLDTDVTYQSDVYGKAAFFMHTLRYIIGDEVFFPTLKKLATDPKYTYDNLISTDDVEALFSSAANTDLKPVFDFYLRTINKLEVRIKQTRDDRYLIQLVNFDSELPIDVKTDKGTERMKLNKEGKVVKGLSAPIVDPDGFYIKRIILE